MSQLHVTILPPFQGGVVHGSLWLMMFSWLGQPETQAKACGEAPFDPREGNPISRISLVRSGSWRALASSYQFHLEASACPPM